MSVGQSYQKDPCTACKCRKGKRGQPAELRCKELNCRRLTKDCVAVAEPREGQCCGDCIPMSTPTAPAAQEPTPTVAFDPGVHVCSVVFANGTVSEYDEGDFRLGQCDACTCDEDGTHSCQFEPIVACPEEPDCEEYKDRELGSCCRKCHKYRMGEPQPGKPLLKKYVRGEL